MVNNNFAILFSLFCMFIVVDDDININIIAIIKSVMVKAETKSDSKYSEFEILYNNNNNYYLLLSLLIPELFYYFYLCIIIIIAVDLIIMKITILFIIIIIIIKHLFCIVAV